MKLISKYYFLIIYLNLNIIIKRCYSKAVLLVLLYDGFRNDYLDRGITPTLTNFRENGVHAEYLKTVYPAIANTVLTTINTGLYPESHGYLMRFTSSKKYFDYKKTDAINKPISELNKDNGGISACMGWSGCSGLYTSGYSGSLPLRQRADTVIGWLNVTDSSKRPNLVMVYVEEVDRITHFFGPLSRNSSLMIKRLDLFTKYIIDKLIEIDVYHMTTIIILSDHGMQKIEDNMEISDKSKIEETEPGPALFNTEDVFGFREMTIDDDNIKEYRTYMDELGDEGQKNAYEIIRIPPGIANGTNRKKVLVEYAACPGWFFSLDQWKIGQFSSYLSRFPKLEAPKYDFTKGVHGYVRQNDAMFMAKGPMIERFKKVEPFEMVDLYCAFAKLLDIQGMFEREGNYSRIMAIFTTHKPVNWISTILIIFALAVAATFLFHIFVEYILLSQATITDSITDSLQIQSFSQ